MINMFKIIDTDIYQRPEKWILKIDFKNQMKILELKIPLFILRIWNIGSTED